MKKAFILFAMCIGTLAMGENLIKNGNFAEGLQFWNKTGEVTAAEPAAGGAGKVVCLVNEARLLQRVSLEPDTDYELSYRLKGDGITPTAPTNSGACIVLNADKVWDRTTPLPNARRMTGSFDWKEHTYRFNSGKFKNKPLSIRLELNAKGKCFFADIRLVKAAAAPAK